MSKRPLNNRNSPNAKKLTLEIPEETPPSFHASMPAGENFGAFGYGFRAGNIGIDKIIKYDINLGDFGYLKIRDRDADDLPVVKVVDIQGQSYTFRKITDPNEARYNILHLKDERGVTWEFLTRNKFKRNSFRPVRKNEKNVNAIIVAANGSETVGKITRYSPKDDVYIGIDDEGYELELPGGYKGDTWEAFVRVTYPRAGGAGGDAAGGGGASRKRKNKKRKTRKMHKIR
jgi:hypothetical protein